MQKGDSKIHRNETKFFIALLTIIIYQILMTLINPVGLSLTKVSITILVWISFFLSFTTFIQRYQVIKFSLPSWGVYIFLAIISWNIINIFRSAINHDGSVTTLLGNSETSLALLVPFSLSFSTYTANLRIINKFFIDLILIALPAYFLFFVLTNGSKEIVYNKAFQFMIYGTFFLITSIPFQSGRKKLIIIAGSILLFYLALVTEYRIMNIRIALLYLSVIALYFFRRFNIKLILFAAILSLSLPFYFLIESVRNGESAFEKYRPESNNEELTDDTRTFLYTEVYADLKQNNKLLIGKGSNGYYYSPYFDEYGGDTDERLSVEVGILALLLKGGIIAVILNLSILFIAIFLAFFRTNNYFVMSIGLMLVIHTIILFITNYLDYSLYNVALWFFIGICLSKKIRLLNDTEIKKYFIS